MTIEEQVRRALEARADLVPTRAAPAMRVEEGHPDGPSGPKRLVAGTVAFAIFAVAAVFGWQAFRPGDHEPVGPSATSATITLASTEDGPSATLSYDGADQSGAFEEYVWCTVTDECTAGSGESAYPPIDEGLAIPAGTPIRFEGDGRVERFVVRTPEGDRASPNVIVDTDGTNASVPEEPGDYLIWIAADWEQGSGSFNLRVRATSPSDGVLPPDPNAPVRFLPADGWVSEADAGGGEDPASAWTSNVSMTAEDITFPDPQLLPPDGVLVRVMQVGDEPPRPDDPNFPPSKLPLTLPEEIETSWEGYAEGMSRQRLLVAVEGRALDITVYYGTDDPSDDQLAAGQAAVERLVVAPLVDGAASFLDDVTHLAPDERWAPNVMTTGGSTTMPITFPDGGTAELRYPSDLRLERYGVYPDMFGRLLGSPYVCGWPVHASRYDPRGGWVRGDAPLDSVVTAGGRVVELWEGTKSHAPYNYLITRIGEWNVIVGCRGSDVIDGDIAIWAESLSGSMAPDGLLFMQDSGPLDMHPGDSGATVRISGDDIVVDVSVSPDECVGGGATDLGADDGVVEWCVGRSLHIYANAFAPKAEPFLQQLVEGLEVTAYRAVPA